MLRSGQPLALYMEGHVASDPGKMGHGILRYSNNPIACVIDSVHAGRRVEDLIATPGSAPIVATLEEAVASGAEVFVLGIAPPGGLIPSAWYAVIDRAVELGLSVVNGLHDLLGPRYPALRDGQWVWDVRLEPAGLGVATGKAALLPNRRVLTVGTDMAVGKMTAGLEIWSAARARGVKAGFVATGQIGIVLTGAGVPLDAIRVDFASGAIEREVVARAEDELVIVEGQGALCHPASTSTLPLLRGTCPTHLVLCCRAGQTHLRRLDAIAIPPLVPYLRLYEDLAATCGTFARPVTAGIAVNTLHLGADEARAAVDAIAEETGLPAVDPVRHGADALVDAMGLARSSPDDPPTRASGQDAAH